jgi:hypothetical protein
VRWAGAVVGIWRLAGGLPPSRISIDASNHQKVSRPNSVTSKTASPFQIYAL